MAVRQEYVFRIGSIYTKTIEDQIEIATDDSNNRKWEAAYKTFKPRIRLHLKRLQNGRCAFCRCIINLGQGYANLEHIISKTDYPQFKTLPENLVYCCWICNKSKRKKNTICNPIANKTLQEFPSSADGFVIVNPYHDNYEDYIDFLDEILIAKRGDSIKGENTIDFYQLARPELAEDRAREFKLNQKQLNHQLLLRLTDVSTSEDILDQINNIILQMPNWTI